MPASKQDIAISISGIGCKGDVHCNSPNVGKGAVNAEADDVVVNYYAPNGEGSRPYYTRNGLIIDLNAKETHADGGGFGGAFNVPAGSVSVTGTHKAVEVSSAGFPLRADTLGVVFLLPKAE